MPSSKKHFRGLYAGFLESASRFPDRPALEVAGQTLNYKALLESAKSVAVSLQEQRSETPLTAVLAHRSLSAFSGILGALLRGHGYVPLNPNFPCERTATMLRRSGATSIVVGNEATSVLPELLHKITDELLVVLPDTPDVSEFRSNHPDHKFVGQHDLQSSGSWAKPDVDEDDIAYLLFTSGSTGQPKGVPVTHANIRHFIDTVTNRYEISEVDRLSQMFELVFDLSIFDLFAAWECGACVCCPTKDEAQIPARYIKDSGITIWFSVPSLALHMKQMRMLRAAAFVNLRLSIFCGEALLADIVESWAVAAPNSRIENVYGPTEVTLACTAYPWDSQTSPAECDNGLVPIGRPFPGLDFIVADENQNEVATGEKGELLMCGPQVAPGYWHDEEKTRAAFIVPPGKSGIYYRTGDLVSMPDNEGPIQYLGRVDHQIKIRGNRVELGEVEAAVREAANVDLAVAIGWPVTSAGADAITAFLVADSADHDSRDLIEKLGERLPVHMVPSAIIFVDTMPLNANGKVDRKALQNSLENVDGSRQPRVNQKTTANDSSKKSDRGIVVLGCPRSGTTLLRRLLDAHPSIACPGETCLFRAVARFLESEVVSDGLEFGVLNGLAFAGFEPTQTLERLRSFAFGFHQEYARRNNKRRWAEKTAIDVFHLPKIVELCGNEVQYIGVIRHGLDVACSIREFSDRGHTYLSEIHQYVKSYPRPLEAFAHAWVDATESILQFQSENPDNVFLLQYEAFVDMPSSEGKKLFEFLGEEWQEDVLKLAFSKSQSLGLGDWKAHSTTTIENTSLNRWRSLPPGVISRLAAICNPTLEKCGYDPIRLQRSDDQSQARRKYNLALELGLGRSDSKVGK